MFEIDLYLYTKKKKKFVYFLVLEKFFICYKEGDVIYIQVTSFIIIMLSLPVGNTVYLYKPRQRINYCMDQTRLSFSPFIWRSHKIMKYKVNSEL